MTEIVKVEKLPIAVQVQFTQEDGTVITLEGPVAYKSGDAVVTGVLGERWPVRRERFMSNYSALSPTVSGCDGLYIKKSASALAQCMDRPFEVEVGHEKNKIRGQKGDWLLHYPDGSKGIVQSGIFSLTYKVNPSKDKL